MGSTAAELACRAHCPVAMIRHFESAPGVQAPIVVEVDMSSEGEAVLARRCRGSLLRGAPLTVISLWQPTFTDVHEAELSENRTVGSEPS